MKFFNIIAALIVISALFAYINFRFCMRHLLLNGTNTRSTLTNFLKWILLTKATKRPR